MSINLKKNEKALLEAYQDVLNDKTDTNWAVFTYEGKTNDLKVSETGDGDLEEMVDELSGGKMMYAFIRIKDPNTELFKYVLVNWAGEGVPSSRKGVCTRHTTDVARFFRGAHVTINARSEMDLEEATVVDKVAKASGANFGYHKEKAKPMPEAGPVGSVYKKADPRAHINRSRDEFWNEQEKLEEQRRIQEKKEASQARLREEKERRDRDAKESSAREKAAEERFQRIDMQKRQEQLAMKKEREEKEAELQSRLNRREKEVDAVMETQKKQQQQQRVHEHSAISSGVRNKKAAFERPAAPVPEKLPARPPKKIIHARELEPEPEPEPNYEEQEPSYEAEQEEPYPEQNEEEPLYEEEPYPARNDEEEPTYEEEPYPAQNDEEPLYEEEPYPAQNDEEEPKEIEQPMYDDVASATQQQPPDDYYGEPEQPLYEDVQGEGGGTGAFYGGEVPGQPMYDDIQGFQDEMNEAIYDDATGVGADSALSARTIYDYQADDDGELSFDVDEIITDIEQLDPGWWRGVRQLDGSYGLFPANYVELI